MRVFFLVTAAVCLVVGQAAVIEAFAAELPSANQSLETMVVDGQRQAQPYSIADVDLTAYSGFSRIIKRDEFEYKFTSLAEVLDKQLGVQLRQSGGWGSYASISVRGSDSRQLNLFIDGVLLNSAQDNAADLNLIPLSSIERIEIYPDFTPVQLGNANIAGAMNIVTRSEHKDFRQLNVRYGSFNSKSTALNLAGGNELTRYAVGYDYLASDNDYKILDLQDTPDVAANHTHARRHNNQVERHGLYAKLSHALSDDTQLQWLTQYIDIDKGLPSKKNHPLNNTTLATESWRHHLKLNTRYAAVEAAHRLYWSDSDIIYDDRKGNIGLYNDFNRLDLEGTGLLNTWGYQHDQHFFTWGIEYAHDKFTDHDELQNLRQLANERDSWVLALQDDWTVTDKLTATGIVRHYHIEDETDQLIKKIGDIDLPDHSNMDESAWHIGLKYPINPSLTFKSNIARAVRIPNLLERFGSRGLLNGNPELEPETSTNFDIGLEFWRHNFSGSISAYNKLAKDYISVIYDARAIGKPENMGSVAIQGIEGEIRQTITSRVTAVMGFEWQDSENRMPIKAFKGKQIPGIYHKHGYLGISYHTTSLYFTNLVLDVTASYDGDMFYDQTNFVAADSKKQLDLSATWFFEPLTLNLLITNALDERFLDFNYFEAAGRGYYLSANYNW